MFRRNSLSLVLATTALALAGLAFPLGLVGGPHDAFAEVKDFDRAGPVFESAPEESLELDDPPAPDASLTRRSPSVAESDRHLPVDQSGRAAAIEPDAPVPLKDLAKS